MRVNNFFKGQTLLGLMIGISLSSFLLIQLMTFYTQIQNQNYHLFLQLKLQAEMQRTLQLIAKDVKRAGFRAINNEVEITNATLFENLEQSAVAISSMSNAPQNSCLIFFYDLNTDGCIGSSVKVKSKSRICINGEQNLAKDIKTEIFGYRKNGMMIDTRQTYQSTINDNCIGEQCQGYISQQLCDVSAGWRALLDADEYEITRFEINWLNDQKNILEIHLTGRLKKEPLIHYESAAIVPILNQIKID